MRLELSKAGTITDRMDNMIDSAMSCGLDFDTICLDENEYREYVTRRGRDYDESIRHNYRGFDVLLEPERKKAFEKSVWLRF